MSREKVPKSQVSQSQTVEYLECLEKVIVALDDLPQGKALAEAITKDCNFIHLVKPHQVVEVSQIQMREGHSPKSLEDDNLDTHFYSYLEAVINRQIRSGMLTDGTCPEDYDDRKIRWSGAGVAGLWSCEGDILTLEVGVTSYPRCRLDLARSPLEALKLMERGLKTYQDPYAYFARGIGVAVIPLTIDGNVYLGERSPEVDCSSILNFVAGWATFSANIKEINFLEDAQRELEEEVGIVMNLNHNNTKFIGISGNPLTGEVDLVFVVQTEVSDRHFHFGSWEEHNRLVSIRNKSEGSTLLQQGLLPGEQLPKTLMYSSRLGLEYLVEHHW